MNSKGKEKCVLFPTTLAQTLFSSISATSCWWFSAIFPRQHYSRQYFRVERFCIMRVQRKQRRSYSIWRLCDPLGLAGQPLLILKFRLKSHTSIWWVEENRICSSPRETASHILQQIKVVIALTRLSSLLYVNIFQPFYRQLLYNMQFQALLNPTGTAKRRRRTVLLHMMMKLDVYGAVSLFFWWILPLPIA